MSLSVPPYSFRAVPDPAEMAGQLVLAVAPNEREEAYELLVTNILPVKLVAIANHPRPQRLTAVVYRELSGLLSGKPPNMRLHALRLCAFDVFIEYMSREAINLAIARYLLEHPATDPATLGHWHSSQVAELMHFDTDDITDIAGRALANVEQWKQTIVAGYPAEWHRYSSGYRVVHGDLQAATTGEFARAGGQLHAFLSERGHTPAPLTTD